MRQMNEYEVNAELRSLLEAFRTRMNAHDADSAESLIWAGEPTVAIELLGAAIAALGEPVSPAVFEKVNQLGLGLGADPSFWSGLRSDPA